MNPNKPPSLHDILASAGDLNTLKPQPLRVLCNALIAFAFQAHDKQMDAESREQATYLALVRRGPPQGSSTIEPHAAKRVRGAATTALLRKRKAKGKRK